VIFAPIADVKEPHLVLPTIARSLGMQDDGNQPVRESLSAAFRNRRVLLVLDNLEQVISAAPEVAELLQHCPGLTILATSRVPLHIRGEQEMSIQPLPLPDPAEERSITALAEVESVALFIQSAQGHTPGFTLTEQNAATIVEICRRLDGLPLAIELAASRLRMLSPTTLLGLLERRLHPLGGSGPRDLPARQQTLKDTIQWSYDLLTTSDQDHFRRLSVFIGGFSIASAMRVTQTSETDLLNALEHLTDHHLVRSKSTPSGETRFRMLETIREFGVEALDEAGELEALQRAHANWCTELAVTSAPALTGNDQAAWLDTLETEHDNLRAALAWCMAKSPANAVRMAAALWRFWWIRGYVREGHSWLRRVLEHSSEVPSADLASALYAAAELAEALSDIPEAIALHKEALAIYEKVTDDVGMAECLNGLGIAARAQGNLDDAEHYHKQALPLLQRAHNRWGEASTLNNLAAVAYYRGDATGAEAQWKQALEIVRETGDLRSAGLLLGNLGAVALQLGQFLQSIALQEESLEVARQLADPGAISRSLINLGSAQTEAGDLDRAREALEEGLLLCRQTEDRRAEANGHYTLGKIALLTRDYASAAKSYLNSLILLARSGELPGAATSLEGLACVASETTLHEDAIRLFSASHCIRETTGAVRESTEDLDHDHDIVASRKAVGRHAADALWQEVLNWSLDETVALAVSLAERVEQMPATELAPTAHRGDSRLISTYGLTPREIEILGFLITHHSDREIADSLFISPRTVGAHMASIRNKLEVSSRREAARIAAELGLA
jgi:predicted ATPase/DNA-binding CsgD family transcriptional regulator